jgi:prevent-host-death family protein
MRQNASHLVRRAEAGEHVTITVAGLEDLITIVAL